MPGKLEVESRKKGITNKKSKNEIAGLNTGVFYAVSTLLAQITKPFFPDATSEVSWMERSKINYHESKETDQRSKTILPELTYTD